MIKAMKVQAQQPPDGHSSNQNDQYIFIRRHEEVQGDFFTLEECAKEHGEASILEHEHGKFYLDYYRGRGIAFDRATIYIDARENKVIIKDCVFIRTIGFRDVPFNSQRFKLEITND